MPKFVEERPYAKVEKAADFLMSLIREHHSPHGDYTDVGIVNRAFLDAGGSVAEYRAAREYAIDQGWIVMHESGSRFLPRDRQP